MQPQVQPLQQMGQQQPFLSPTNPNQAGMPFNPNFNAGPFGLNPPQSKVKYVS